MVLNDDPFLVSNVLDATVLEGGSATLTIHRHGSDLAPRIVEYDLVPATWDSNTPPSGHRAEAPSTISAITTPFL